MRMYIHKVQNSSSQWIEEESDIAREEVDYCNQL